MFYLKRLLLKGDNNIKLELEEIMEGKSINKIIDDNIIRSEVEDSNENFCKEFIMKEIDQTMNNKQIQDYA